MSKLWILSLLAIIALPANTAWCAATKSQVYKISVTIPASVNNSSPSVQTQRLIRNNKTITVMSIVVP